MTAVEFGDFFRRATGHEPFGYQGRLATGPLPEMLVVPTGAGKTAAAAASWIWRRRFAGPQQVEETPRRLVWCLPMRSLVEQTADVIQTMVGNLGLDIPVFRMLGGHTEQDWELRPEGEAVIVGTQDLLLSRALNRGFAMSRYRWPIPFALLNNDVMWVVDEIQLVGAGLPTTAQLQGFRRSLGVYGPSHTLWMSATAQPGWLQTVDHPQVDGVLGLDDEDRSHPVLAKRLHASKRLEFVDEPSKAALAALVLDTHRPGTRTLLVRNQVGRAVDLYDALVRKIRKGGPEVVLLHSRFRPPDRQAHLRAALRPPEGEGTIVVSTQVVEAGVDLSSAALISDLAPWASLVQRLGRLNRYGEEAEARALVLAPSNVTKWAAPYHPDELTAAQEIVEKLPDAAPIELPPVGPSQEVFTHLRRRDLIMLFDTEPDLTGNDLDVSPFIRETDEREVHVLWRTVVDGHPREGRPTPEELCPVPIADLRQALGDERLGSRMWVWDQLEETWRRPQTADIRPGTTVFIAADAGGYDPSRGWSPKATDPVADIGGDQAGEDAMAREWSTWVGYWQALAEHLMQTGSEMRRLLTDLPVPEDLHEELWKAAVWHDVGKAHPVFQEVTGQLDPPGPGPWAKTPNRTSRYRRRCETCGQSPMVPFRHEVASAIAALQAGESDLVSYLVMAHHGKVRLRLKGLPNDHDPSHGTGDIRAIRGVWDGDLLPAVEVGDLNVGPLALDLSSSELGAGSWSERVAGLRDELGPFRLAYLETLVRVADWRASERGGDRG